MGAGGKRTFQAIRYTRYISEPYNDLCNSPLSYCSRICFESCDLQQSSVDHEKYVVEMALLLRQIRGIAVTAKTALSTTISDPVFGEL